MLIRGAKPGRDRLLLEVDYFGGLRVSELVGLTWSQVIRRMMTGGAPLLPVHLAGSVILRQHVVPVRLAVGLHGSHAHGARSPPIDGHIEVAYLALHELGNEFAPFHIPAFTAIRNLGPWAGGPEGEINRLRLPYRAMLAEHAFVVIYAPLAQLQLEAVASVHALHPGTT